jgi:hypothetical protein
VTSELVSSRLLERLDTLGCHVEQFVVLPLMNESGNAADFIQELWGDLPRLLGLTPVERQWYDDTKGSGSSGIRFLDDLCVEGVFFSIHGRVLRSLKGSAIFVFEGYSVIEYGYASSFSQLEKSINDALDIIEPRLVIKGEKNDHN